MSDPKQAVSVLRALRASGLGVSVDDFGTGNASIEYLAALPATELKIDRSLVTNMLDDSRSEAIVRSTIDLARNLDLRVVAEGIETEAVMDHLAAIGCQTGQGYFISRPLPPDELTRELMRTFGIGSAGRGVVARVAESQAVRGHGCSRSRAMSCQLSDAPATRRESVRAATSPRPGRADPRCIAAGRRGGRGACWRASLRPMRSGAFSRWSSGSASALTRFARLFAG